MGNSRLRADHYVVADGKMPRHPSLAGKNDVTAELGTSRQPHLSAEESVFTYVTAVSYLHEVIHLGPAAQARDPDASPIDAGVGLDFDVVLDHHRSWLNNLAVGAVGLTGEAKSIAAYDRAVLQNHVIADLHVFAYHRVRVGENVQIGNDVILQNGAIVGGDGFGFARQADGSYRKIVQPGTVVIEDNVEIQSNACIDRASVGVTRLRRGAKVDNLVQVGHGCDIGENTLLCGQVGLAGSSKLGRNVILAGQVGEAGHLSNGDTVMVSSQSGIPHDVDPNKILSGYPAMDNYLWLKCCAVYTRLPEMYSALRKIRNYLEKNGAPV